jgi:hypothetical protein
MPYRCPDGHASMSTPRPPRCPLDRLDGRPTAGPDEADRATTGWPMSGHPRDRRHPLGGPTFARVTAPGGARPPRTAPRDGTCAAALTAAATGQLPSTTRHEAAPRRTALVRWDWRVRGEGNGTTERWRCAGWGWWALEWHWLWADVSVEGGAERDAGCGMVPLAGVGSRRMEQLLEGGQGASPRRRLTCMHTE